MSATIPEITSEITPEPALPRLIQAMLKPDVYPHPVKQPIELIQTHISDILLTGDYAYKLKKPVNFGFLDFSTLALRKHFTHEELRLNQRAASELYLSVVAITKTETGFELDGKGVPVEYAVKMKQFPAGNLFLDLLHRGQLNPELMIILAYQVADFHRHATVNDRIRSFGSIEKIRSAIDENYTQTQAFIGRGQTQQQWQETQAYTNHQFEAGNDTSGRDRFQARLDQNKIRECHGDLHLGNICLWGDRVFLFDCIEFNEAFRFTDTICDVAFAVMDCEAQGRADFGNIFLNAYLEASGDWGGVSVLSLYLSRQAYVRAKVNSFLLDDPQVEAGEVPKIQARARAYYHLAWRYTQAKAGRLILMSGLSGSGKSTIAGQLAPRLGAIWIRSDAVRKHLAGISLLARDGLDASGAELYSPEMGQKTYARLLELGLMLAGLGETVILDAKYDRVALRQAVLARAKRAGIPIAILSCEAPLEVLRERLNQRRGDVSDATADLLAAQSVSAAGFTPEEALWVTHLDTQQDITQALEDFIGAMSPIAHPSISTNANGVLKISKESDRRC